MLAGLKTSKHRNEEHKESCTTAAVTHFRAQILQFVSVTQLIEENYISAT
jgi:hypothetical protein